MSNKFLDKIIRVAAVTPELDVANIDFNVQKIVECTRDAFKSGARVIVFPELSITGYTCGDLFFQSSLIEGAIKGLGDIAEATSGMAAIIALGLPVPLNGRMYNCAALIQSGKVLGIVPKQVIPNKKEFYEARWFSSGENLINQYVNILNQTIPIGIDLVFHEKHSGLTLGVEICEDLWAPVPPSSKLALSGANLIVNLSASNALVGKAENRKELIRGHSEKILCGYVYASSGPFESTSELVFSAHCVVSECGKILAEQNLISLEANIILGDIDLELIQYERLMSPGFSESSKTEKLNVIHIDHFINSKGKVAGYLRHNSPRPFIPDNEEKKDIVCFEIISIQSAALQKRMLSGKFEKIVIGLSGGLDSTLALLVAELTFSKLGLDKSGIIAVTMPGFGTSQRTLNNVIALSRVIGVSLKEIPIVENAYINFSDIGHDIDCHDVVYENVQARIRTQILMNISNKESGFVLGTGDLSEAALGWCTFNGDHMSMYHINCGIPKTLIKYLIQWFSDDSEHHKSREILQDILNTPISPELIPLGSEGGNKLQLTEELVGPYELHDYFLFNFIRNGYSPQKIFYFARLAFAEKYKDQAILMWLKIFFKRFFSQQYKRSAAPDGPKIGTVGLSPKSDWRMPSDVSATTWLMEIENINQIYD